MIKAYQLIEKPENWTQGAYARNQKGESTSNDLLSGIKYTSFCFCISGAIIYCYDGEERVEPRRKLSTYCHEVIKDINYIAFNDTHTHQECYELLKRLDI